MPAKSATSPATMEKPEESTKASPVDGVGETLNELTITSGSVSRKKKASVPTSNLSIHPTPYMMLQSPVFAPHALSTPPNSERSYLLENRQRQHERGERLANALQIIEVRINSMQSKGEARKLRKEAGLLKKKIAESLRQEQLITLRLNDIQNEDFSQSSYWQAQSAGLISYATPWSPYSPITPWSPMTLPMMSPNDGAVSPLTPLPPGLYHPSPMVPSPLTSPYWLGAQYQPQYQTMAAYGYSGAGFQQPYMPVEATTGEPSCRQSMAPTVAKRSKSEHKPNKSVDFKLPQEEAYRGRRWSLADTFSPKPKDKRMSIPGLEIIWKSNKEKDE